MAKTYSEAGVDIKRGDDFAAHIGRIQSPAIAGRYLGPRGVLDGGFSSGFELDRDAYKNPVIMTTTDGVGTKILVARALERYDTIGIDLVAMCVNDLVVHGARPITFLDYIACGRIETRVLNPIISGIVRGCEVAGCTLSGGETAEMPDMYETNDIDLAGFAVGVAERDRMLPRVDDITIGAQVFGLPSSGVHSNGFSLARKLVTPTEGELYATLLTPTRIYVREMLALCETDCILAAAHVTGGGLLGNLKRVLPEEMTAALNYAWKTPEVFNEIQKRGNVSDDEMRRVFNMGIGMLLVVAGDKVDFVTRFAKKAEIELVHAGEIIGA